MTKNTKTKNIKSAKAKPVAGKFKLKKLGNVKLYRGDCLDVLRALPDNSIDSIVTDPPYGISFMGKKWDIDVPSKRIWVECLRVLKPGGHLLSFAGTRTHHHMAMRIEKAGFEIRDMLTWNYSTGFPKSMDISKATDNAGGLSPASQASLLRASRERCGLSRDQVASAVGCTVSSVRDWEEGRARHAGAPIEFMVPTPKYRVKLQKLFGYSSDQRSVLGVSTDRRGDNTRYAIGHSGQMRIGGNTSLSRHWQGWGTALKPSLEPITLARKPVEGTVAANVLKHGTGAINIDGCRVGSEQTITVRNGDSGANGRYGKDARKFERVNPPGRFPANFIHDGSDDVTSLFPNSPSSGSAARFFHCAKPAKSEKGEGNNHPTIKPITLMRYLCRLVTPPNGVVLDPFMGSGTTGLAAMSERFKFVGIERERDFHKICVDRVRKHKRKLRDTPKGDAQPTKKRTDEAKAKAKRKSTTTRKAKK